jgi:hypothetical protein
MINCENYIMLLPIEYYFVARSGYSPFFLLGAVLYGVPGIT